MTYQENQRSNALATSSGPGAMAMNSGGAGGGLMPKTLGEAMELARILADSNFVPKDFQGKPGNVLTAVQWGSELGLLPMQAMQNIAVINGRPSLWGDAVLALVRGSGALESLDEQVHGEGADMNAVCIVKRRGEPAVTREFSMAEAKSAGLAGKQGPWQQYPKRMLQLRARGFALRDVFADVLKGMYVAELAQDEPREMRDVTPADDAPKTKAEGVKAKVAAKRGRATEKAADKAPTLDAALKAIAAADTEDELKATIPMAGGLGDDDKAAARKAYTQRLEKIRADAAEPEHDEDGVISEGDDLAEEGAPGSAEWDAGVAAFKAGERFEDNPYSVTEERAQAADWAGGFRGAEKADAE